MKIHLDLNSLESYSLFLRAKRLPCYRIRGREIEFPDEYAATLGLADRRTFDSDYDPLPGLFDYQAAVSRLAIRKRKFAVFMRMGLGKTLIFLEFARHCLRVLPPHRKVLVVSPLMVIKQTIAECQRFYGDSLPVEQVRAAKLNDWLAGKHGGRFGVTNYESLRDGLKAGALGALIIEESSSMKSHYGKWAQMCIELGRGLDWKLCLTGTPAPNDRIEYANHGVFLDHFPNVNSFLARFFVNRGQTNERWEMKAHALRPFYTALSHWSIFVDNPATYGWRDNVATIPPIHVHIHDVPLTDEQHSHVTSVGGDMYGTPGGITSRSKLSQLAKGRINGKSVATNKPGYIRDLVASWPGESTIIWAKYNEEQRTLERAFPDALSMDGSTKESERERMIDEFKAGRASILVSKPDVLGFGLNLQIATRQVFSGLEDSYESYAQAVARSNRVGSTLPLNVHIPVTELERPMVDTVLRKAKNVQQDAAEQEALFNEVGREFLAM